jgi:hypothetical protein
LEPGERGDSVHRDQTDFGDHDGERESKNPIYIKASLIVIKVCFLRDHDGGLITMESPPPGGLPPIVITSIVITPVITMAEPAITKGCRAKTLHRDHRSVFDHDGGKGVN